MFASVNQAFRLPRNRYVISNRFVLALIVAWLAAFAWLPLAAMLLPQKGVTAAVDFALMMFVIARCALGTTSRSRTGNTHAQVIAQRQ